MAKVLIHFTYEVKLYQVVSFDIAEIAKHLGITKARCIKLASNDELLDEYREEIRTYIDDARATVAETSEEELSGIEYETEEI